MQNRKPKLNIKNQGIFKSVNEFQFIKDPVKNKPLLGTGSFGEVKLARHLQSNVYYAIKIMDLKTLNSKNEIKGIEQECEIQLTLDHPNIVKLYDAFIENNQLYMVMEWVKNGNLYSHLFRKKVFNEQEAFKYFFQTCLAFQYIHNLNISHRDLKPENLLLDQDFNIKLCDFGWCAREIEQQRNTFCGTLEYMAPEIIFSRPYDYKIDIWALGVLLYELLHGHAPFKGKVYEEIKQKLELGQVTFSSTLSTGARNLIAEILQSNPQRRIDLETIFKNQWVQNMLQEDTLMKKFDKSQFLNHYNHQQTNQKLNYQASLKQLSSFNNNNNNNSQNDLNKTQKIQSSNSKNQQQNTQYSNYQQDEYEEQNIVNKPLISQPERIQKNLDFQQTSKFNNPIVMDRPAYQFPNKKQQFDLLQQKGSQLNLQQQKKNMLLQFEPQTPQQIIQQQNGQPLQKQYGYQQQNKGQQQTQQIKQLQKIIDIDQELSGKKQNTNSDNDNLFNNNSGLFTNVTCQLFNNNLCKNNNTIQQEKGQFRKSPEKLQQIPQNRQKRIFSNGNLLNNSNINNNISNNTNNMDTYIKNSNGNSRRKIFEMNNDQNKKIDNQNILNTTNQKQIEKIQQNLNNNNNTNNRHMRSISMNFVENINGQQQHIVLDYSQNIKQMNKTSFNNSSRGNLQQKNKIFGDYNNDSNQNIHNKENINFQNKKNIFQENIGYSRNKKSKTSIFDIKDVQNIQQQKYFQNIDNIQQKRNPIQRQFSQQPKQFNENIYNENKNYQQNVQQGTNNNNNSITTDITKFFANIFNI